MAAIIVGGSSGIGLAVARRLSQRGYLIGVCARNVERLTSAVEGLREEAGADAPPILQASCDAASRSDLAQMINDLTTAEQRRAAEYGTAPLGLMAAVNCAGIAGNGLIVRQSEQDVLDTVSASLTSSILLVQEASKVMVKQKRGSIVLTSSVAAHRPRVGQSAYAASKSGVEGLVRAAGAELGRFGVRVNGVAPGFIETRMTDGSITEKAAASIVRNTPLRRFGQPDEVASVIDFLLSPHLVGKGGGAEGDDGAAFMTGQTVVVDGGLSTSGDF